MKATVIAALLLSHAGADFETSVNDKMSFPSPEDNIYWYCNYVLYYMLLTKLVIINDAEIQFVAFSGVRVRQLSSDGRRETIVVLPLPVYQEFYNRREIIPGVYFR